MNAPVISLPSQRMQRNLLEGMPSSIEGVARHVSAEGCQFVVRGAVVVAGQRLGFAWHRRAIAGTARWVLADRIGFAFDRRIDAETCAQMTGRSIVLRALGSDAAITAG